MRTIMVVRTTAAVVVIGVAVFFVQVAGGGENAGIETEEPSKLSGEKPSTLETVQANHAAGFLISPSFAEFTYVDQSFDRYVDCRMLAKGISEGDASLLVDVGLQLRGGERILLRDHAAASAESVLKAALQLAVQSNDVATIERIERAAVNEDWTWKEKITTSLKLAAGNRDAAPKFPSVSVTEESAVRYVNAIANDLAIALRLGDRSRALEVASFIAEAQFLNEEKNKALHTHAMVTADMLPKKKRSDDAVDHLAAKLSSVSRGRKWYSSYNICTLAPRPNPGFYYVRGGTIRFLSRIVRAPSFRPESLRPEVNRLLNDRSLANRTLPWDRKYYCLRVPRSDSEFLILVAHFIPSDQRFPQQYHYVAIKGAPRRWIVMNSNGKCWFPGNKETVRIGGQFALNNQVMEKIEFAIYNPENYKAGDERWIRYGFGGY